MRQLSGSIQIDYAHTDNGCHTIGACLVIWVKTIKILLASKVFQKKNIIHTVIVRAPTLVTSNVLMPPFSARFQNKYLPACVSCLHI